MAIVYLRMCRNLDGDAGEFKWFVLDHENEELIVAPELMDPSSPKYRKGSATLAVGSKIFLFTTSEEQEFVCDSLYSVDTSSKPPQWIEEERMPRCLNIPRFTHMDDKIWIINHCWDRWEKNVWAYFYDLRTKKWSTINLPSQLPYEAGQEAEDKGCYLLKPIVADPHNSRILMCYNRPNLTCYEPDSHTVISLDNEVEVWGKCQVVVGNVLISSAGEVDSLGDSLLAHDLANGARALPIRWVYSEHCKNEDHFAYTSESQWDAVLDMGNSELLLAREMTALAGKGVKFYIGGLVVKVDSSHGDVIHLTVISAFLVHMKEARYRCRDFLSIVPPPQHSPE